MKKVAFLLASSVNTRRNKALAPLNCYEEIRTDRDYLLVRTFGIPSLGEIVVRARAVLNVERDAIVPKLGQARRLFTAYR